MLALHTSIEARLSTFCRGIHPWRVERAKLDCPHRGHSLIVRCRGCLNHAAVAIDRKDVPRVEKRTTRADPWDLSGFLDVYDEASSRFHREPNTGVHSEFAKDYWTDLKRTLRSEVKFRVANTQGRAIRSKGGYSCDIEAA